MEKIILIDSFGNETEVNMNHTKPPHTPETVLGVKNNVYEDRDYTISILDEAISGEISVYLNGEAVKSYISDGNICFYPNDSNIFANIYGFAQISILVKTAGTEQWFFSDFLSVLVKANNKNMSVKSMISYVYENSEEYLFKDSASVQIGNSNRSHDFWSQILLLEEIANVYERNYGYFMANSRYKLERKEVLDRTEKLQYIDGKTVQYIVQHPEYLEKNVVGIKYGSQTYFPKKTLMLQNIISYDIYENQVVLGFLDTMMNSIEEFKNAITAFIEGTSDASEVVDGYLISSFILYSNAREKLHEYQEKINDLENMFRQLVVSYNNVFPISKKTFLMPKPTAIFTNVPQYNSIYTCIQKWYSRSAYDFREERLMMEFFNAPEIYEAYVLLKLIAQIRDIGYELTETIHVDYPRRKQWKYQNKEYNNTFKFTHDNSSITLYYEPIIYTEDSREINNIGLYRNNTVANGKDSDDEYKGHYYVPDYILKYTFEDKETYIISDAKFSSESKTRYTHVPDLAYKYLTSISTIDEKSEIRGLYLYYALTGDKMKSESFYDVDVTGAKKITPEIRLVPLSEDIPYTSQDNNVVEMLRRLMN